MSDLTASEIGDQNAQPATPTPKPPQQAEQSERERNRLGRTAMIMAIAVIGLSLVTSVLVGLFATTVFGYRTATSVSFRAVPDQGLFAAQAFFGTVFGIWAVVQGIVAVAKNRGRTFGVVAIILGASAPIVSVIVWTVLGGAFGHHVTP